MRGERGSLVVALALVSALTAACHGGKSKRGEAPPPKPPARAVQTAVVERSAAGGEIGMPGVVQARQRAALAARIQATVVELPFREGEAVAAGAVVVRLDDAAARSAVAAAEAAVQAAEADQARAESLLQKGAGTPRELEGARAQAAAARSQLAAAQDNLAYAALRAPFAGTVASRPVNLGDVVRPGTTLIEIEGSGGLELRASVEAELVRSLRPGLELQARVDGQAAPLPVRVRSVSAAGDPETHRFEVKADLPAAEGLRSGLFARLIVPQPGAEPRLSVPAQAVFARGGLQGVYVVAEGRARLRWVAAGETRDGRTEIRAGLAAGERVALAPAELVDGTPVEERS